jgi:hypothetical protein
LAATFVLIHSPLVGPRTWPLVAKSLEDRAVETIIPALSCSEHERPYWEQHASEVSASLESTLPDTPLVLVNHSGAGPIVPAIRQRSNRNVTGYIFVDAGIPQDGLSRLDLMALESPEFAGQFRDALQAGARFPAWTEEDLRDIVPNAELRRRLIDELCPRSLDFFEEPIPVFAGWPDAPCAYLQFTPTYAVFAEQAETDNWAVRQLEGGHFHMLVDPDAVARELIDLAGDMT